MAGGVAGGFPQLDAAADVFAHNDGVINHQPGG